MVAWSHDVRAAWELHAARPTNAQVVGPVDLSSVPADPRMTQPWCGGAIGTIATDVGRRVRSPIGSYRPGRIAMVRRRTRDDEG